MELVRLPRKEERNNQRNHGRGNNHQLLDAPLLLNESQEEERGAPDAFMDEYTARLDGEYSTRRSQRQHGRNRRIPIRPLRRGTTQSSRSRQTPIPPIGPSKYEPPTPQRGLVVVPGMELAQQEDRYQRITQQERIRDRCRPVPKNKNPAEDRAIGIFSNGFACFQCVRTQEVAITENFGRFDEILYQPGYYCMLWPFSTIAARLSLRIQQLDVTIESKTKDNVFVHLNVSVQYRVIADRVFDAFYCLQDSNIQIRTYVFDVVRSTVPSLTVDEIFSSKTSISNAVWIRLQSTMRIYGYEIMYTLVTEITPNQVVKASMNEMNAAKREKEAMPYKAEAQRVQVVKAAEASSEQSHLSGVGTARERIEIAKGMEGCVSAWQNDQQHTSYKDVMDLLLLSQYLDTLAAVGSDTLMMCYEPGEVFEVQKGLPTKHRIPDLLS